RLRKRNVLVLIATIREKLDLEIGKSRRHASPAARDCAELLRGEPPRSRDLYRPSLISPKRHSTLSILPAIAIDRGLVRLPLDPNRRREPNTLLIPGAILFDAVVSA